MNDPKKPTPQQLVEESRKKIQESLRESFLATETQLFNEIIQDAANNRTKIPEPVFVKEFLPYFSGKESVKNKPDVITNWIGIAGSPTAEVDVVSENGDHLYTVPGFYDTTVINAVSRNVSGKVSQIVTRFQQENTNIPALATRNANVALDGIKDNLFQPSQNIQQNKDRWDQIFTRYGIDKTPNSNNKEDKESLPVRNDLEYD